MSSWFEKIRATPNVLANANVHTYDFLYQPYGRHSSDNGWEKKFLAPNARAWEKQLDKMGVPQNEYKFDTLFREYARKPRAVDILVTHKSLDPGCEVYLVPQHRAGDYYCDSQFGEDPKIKVVGRLVKEGRRLRVDFLPGFEHLAH